jgi:hypothetical protein
LVLVFPFLDVFRHLLAQNYYKKLNGGVFLFSYTFCEVSLDFISQKGDAFLHEDPTDYGPELTEALGSSVED